MERVQIEATVGSNGRIVIEHLPFDEGETVEIVISETNKGKSASAEEKYPLRGTVYRYDDPFDPAVPLEDWEVLQ